MKNLSDVLSHLMSTAGIGSAELARKTGIGQPVIYRLMTGATENPQILTLKPIADYFGKSIDQLIGISPLNSMTPPTHVVLHDLGNKLSSIKTIASVLIDFLPPLIEGYQKALSMNLIKETVSSDILPLLMLNTTNLIKMTGYIQELLLSDHNKIKD
ncbi:MAG TPA: helix-turn-helix transcriptional regulator [Gammaproteobacteria bacterium]|nr:helix-turn-helix transcriptional regulator [Gammaproteobacteria bacterium]